MRRVAILALAALCAALPVPASGQPLPEPGFATGGTPGTCVRPDPNDPAQTINPYGDLCSRLKFAYGPIVVQPGDNDVGLAFKTIEKPWYDGWMTGIAPNLVRSDGSVPDIEDIHLHHATWLSYPEYGNGPFFAAGEEKTIARFPVGYGMPVRATDVWYFVHMVHNEGPGAEVVWITYDVDYIRQADALALGLKRIRPFWLDVWKNGRRSGYPVYNTHRGYGGTITDPLTLGIVTDPATGQPLTTKECTWPRDECAAHDSWSGPDVGQGNAGNGKGTDVLATRTMAGTLIGIGGHLHPGGLRVEVDAIRCIEGPAIAQGISTWEGARCPDTNGDGVASEDGRRIFTSDATYFEHDPVSWDFSMTVTGLPRWKVNIREGQFLRINSVYESDIASWYEGMGIAVAYVHPGEYYGIDPFSADVVNDVGAEQCWAAAGPNTLCTRGVITHGPLPEAHNRGGEGAGAWTAPAGPLTSEVVIAGFNYVPGDLGTIDALGIPQVKRGTPLTFWSADAAANVYHTITACAYPCNGAPGIAYPLADFGYGRADLAPDGAGPVAFDSSELGYSTFFGPARSRVPPDDELGADWLRNGVAWSMTPADYGLAAGQTYTYFCRIHPFMRGAFSVVE